MAFNQRTGTLGRDAGMKGKTRHSARCRACAALLYVKPLLLYTNMPGAAQHLPDVAALATDRGQDLEVCQCSGCGLVQLSNTPVTYYRDVIRAAAVSMEMKEFRIGQFSRFIAEYGLKGKKVLEIGCGKGEFLSLMRECGADAYGIEHEPDSVAVCTDIGLKVRRGFPSSDSAKIPDAPFDAFFMLNFLEHLPDIPDVLSGISANLFEEAVGLIEVPNFDMIVDKGLFSEFIGDHLYYFTRDTLASTLTRNGFQLLECTTVWHDYILSATVRKRTPLDLSGFVQMQEELTRELHQFIERFDRNRVSVWGAGHQALALLALAGLSRSIRYVVDSAPFKQGCFTPVTHIPILAPSALDTDPVDAIIVMAASYSDEVTGIIKGKYGNKIAVAIVRSHGLELV